MAKLSAQTVQRIAIFIIAIVVGGGTIGFYFLTIINNNQQADQQQGLNDQLKQYQQQQEQAAKDRLKTLKPLDGYAATAFDAASVADLKSEDLVVGSGDTVMSTSKIKANYFGWLPDGSLFDSTNINGSVTPAEFSLDGVIKGWTDGVPGMKVGGVRKLTIPASQAYGATGSPPTIPANTPLVFIIQIVAITS